MLFGPSVPPGFEYRPDIVSPDEERELVAIIGALEFQAVEMRGAVARRRTVHYGWTYGYYARRTQPGPPLPEWLHGVRARAAEWARLEPALFVEALVTEYPPGAPIGWHRDAPQFGDVVAGISLLNSSRMKFRPYLPPAGGSHVASSFSPEAGVASGFSRTVRKTTHEIELAPRSGYLITGEARRGFEHSIPPVPALRYSITFRTLR